jgi:hypothetical protein
MIFNYYEINKFPVVVIDDFYDLEASEKIWGEMCFLNNDSRKMNGDPESTGSAYDRDSNGNLFFLKQLKALYLDDVYQGNRTISNILLENRKIFSLEIVNKLIELHPFFKYLSWANHDTTILNYYENSDHYLPHIDLSIITALTWFYKKPKAFVGGELVIENELTVDCNYNRIVIFPSMLRHEVKPVTLHGEFLNQNYGRFSISQLILMKAPQKT